MKQLLVRMIVPIIFLTMGITSCDTGTGGGGSGSSSIAVTGITLDQTDLELGIGGTKQLTATVTPANADNPAVSWNSNNPDVVTVSEEGLVKAKTPGSAVITAETFDGSFTANCSITVREAYAVHFETNGGSAIADIIVDKGETLPLPAAPEKPGYTFSGWYADAVLDIPWNADDSINAATTLYAKWELVSYSITYELNGSTQDNRNPTSYTIEDADLTLYAPAPPTMEFPLFFMGWTFASSPTSSDNVFDVLPAGTTGNITLYPCWVAAKFLAYNSNDADNLMESRKYPQNSSFPLESNFFSTEYRSFAGWADSSSASDPDYTENGIYTIYEDNAVVYAIWRNYFDLQGNIISGVTQYWNESPDLRIPPILYGTTVSGFDVRAFQGNRSIKNISVNSWVDVYTIGSYAFSRSSIENFTISSQGIWISTEAFYSCLNLESVTFNTASLTWFSDVFYGCTSLKSVTLPPAINGQEVPLRAFQNCTSLTEINLPDTIQVISSNAFLHCESLETLDLPTQLAQIGQGAIAHCKSLTSLDLHDVAVIENLAFKGCTNLSSVTVNTLTPPTLGTDVFMDCSEDLKIYVPANLVDNYKTSGNWSNYADKIVAQP